jgi:DNA-binding XRE family transcriptional regulator
MPRSQIVTEAELAGLARQFREQAGKTKNEAAVALRVGRTSVQLAEENPEQSLNKLRIRLIEKYSGFKITGPYYRLEPK